MQDWACFRVIADLETSRNEKKTYFPTFWYQKSELNWGVPRIQNFGVSGERLFGFPSFSISGKTQICIISHRTDPDSVMT